jgi:hypothetical protein
MGTGYIYNGFGRYEVNEAGEKGITLPYGGFKFWLPYEKVIAIPDYTLREVDHKAMAEAGEDGEGRVMYKTTPIAGTRIQAELLNNEIPVPNKDKGIIPVLVHRDKYTDEHWTVLAGHDEAGVPLMAEVRGIAPSEDEKKTAALLAEEYKALVVQNFLNSQREFMARGKGKAIPTGMEVVFMKELGIKPLDDIGRLQAIPQVQQAGAGLGPDAFNEFLKLLRQAVLTGAAPEATKPVSAGEGLL